jgi:molybdopterin-guanine dinucleotide biosynthesis protein A
MTGSRSIGAVDRATGFNFPLRLPRMSPIPELRFEGVVLAAGRSLRMRTDKANLAWADGERLWQRQWRILGEAGIARRWLSVRSDQAWVPADVAVVRDAVPDAGPLAGMLAAGAAGDGTHVVVLAVDLPEVSVEWVWALMARAKPGCGVVGRWLDGTYEPLAALYPREWLGEWRARFGIAASPPGLQTLLREREEAGGVVVIPLGPEHEPGFRNANTPEDLRPFPSPGARSALP